MFGQVIAAASQVWPAFVLVVGLLLVGVVAERDGLFDWAGSWLSQLPVGPRSLLIVALALVAFVTAILNLDTSVFFMTPVLVHLARHRGLDERPFLYGAVFMSNSASLFLPGSNLTNLIVLHGEHVSGATFFARTWPAATASVAATALVLLLIFRRDLTGGHPEPPAPFTARFGVGVCAVAVVSVLVLALRSPALPVLVVGVVAVILGRTSVERIRAAVDVRVIGLLFVLAVGIGSVGRWWSEPHALFDSLDRWSTAGLSALISVAVNNLPAAVLLTPAEPHHARALLLGLNLGPNLAVTGSLSAFLWLRVARSLGAQPSVRTYSAIGLILMPVSLLAALATISVTSPGS